ncbi:hypothetical protein EBH_0058200 [Eimeria brunetti]|uniref:Uncharacterized protein n=1 Tax=Eimeria brunetti TaxID=51314 RepID=U6LYF7_9EIME|nr:hypothetical protein EBH_0058200 [Eimeria brunetti]
MGFEAAVCHLKDPTLQQQALLWLSLDKNENSIQEAKRILEEEKEEPLKELFCKHLVFGTQQQQQQQQILQQQQQQYQQQQQQHQQQQQQQHQQHQQHQQQQQQQHQQHQQQQQQQRQLYF